jgi:anti-sigma B factor antagonist
MSYWGPSLPSRSTGDEGIAGWRRRADFDLEVARDGERAIVRPSGDVDLATSGQLTAAVLGLLNHGCARVMLDLRAVTFLDSSGIRALVAVHQRAEELHVRLSVTLGGGQTRRVLELTGLLDHLHLEGPPDGEGSRAYRA